MSNVIRTLRKTKWASYSLPTVGVAGLTASLIPLRANINSTTVGFAYLLIVLAVAILWGSKPALLASAIAGLCFNFFFLRPLYTFTIADPQNWIALTAFFITALAVGQLSARAKRRAEEAESGRVEIRRLYEELREAFERASEAEALRRSEGFKTALLDAVTHDLRTPLTSIKASATLLIEDREMAEPVETLSPAEQLKMLKVISSESDRLDRFVESIVELARIEAGNLRLHRNWGPVEEIIDAAVARAEPLLQQHPLSIVVADELPVIRVDARAVAEVLYTLIDNAAKYAPPETCITIQAKSAPHEMVQISVADQGVGVPARLREKVFDKFFQANPRVGPSGRLEGVGMGLSIARGIVEAHDGRIWIEAGPGARGTSVNFTVPVGDDEEVSPNAGDAKVFALRSERGV